MIDVENIYDAFVDANKGKKPAYKVHREALKAVAVAVREECAKVCGGIADTRLDHAKSPYIICAAAIRALGDAK